ncbi:MAG: tRNA pseudouridine(38-40) synthase TruA [Bdellovibrionaceae bacterium]|nr:tRNA pseudouridine(38-40) synthase TruA [Pseudobdellovibrionaceae bacterium]
MSQKPTQKIRLLLAYDGTDFGGWQKQLEGKPTIQGSLESVFSRLFDEPIQVVGSGRTDAGVHAIGQVAHLKTTKDVSRYQLVRAANALLPPGIVIRRAWAAPDDFHALASATHKTYRYWVHNSPVPSALRGRYLTWIPRPLDLDYLQACLTPIKGEHDFASFQTSGTDSGPTVRHLREASWTRKSSNLLCFSVTSQGFLKQMVRNLVGTMVDLHFAGRPASDMGVILAAQNRQKALGTARPEGLHLCRVYYPRDLDNRCRTL